MCEKTQKVEKHEQLTEAWERAREMIRNENDLINQRLSWMLAAQAFLFAALVVGVKEALDMQDTFNRFLMVFFLLPVIYVGFLSSLCAFRMVRDADEQREFAADYWNRRSRELLGLGERRLNSAADGQFENAIFSSGLPERVHGNNLGTKCFGILSKVPGAERFTRDHTFPKALSYTWGAVLILWFVLVLKCVTPP